MESMHNRILRTMKARISGLEEGAPEEIFTAPKQERTRAFLSRAEK